MNPVLFIVVVVAMSILLAVVAGVIWWAEHPSRETLKLLRGEDR